MSILNLPQDVLSEAISLLGDRDRPLPGVSREFDRAAQLSAESTHQAILTRVKNDAVLQTLLPKGYDASTKEIVVLKHINHLLSKRLKALGPKGEKTLGDINRSFRRAGQDIMCFDRFKGLADAIIDTKLPTLQEIKKRNQNALRCSFPLIGLLCCIASIICISLGAPWLVPILIFGIDLLLSIVVDRAFAYGQDKYLPNYYFPRLELQLIAKARRTDPTVKDDELSNLVQTHRDLRPDWDEMLRQGYREYLNSQRR